MTRTVTERQDLAGLYPEEIAARLAGLDGARPYTSKLLFRWAYQRRERDFARMSDVPRRLRERLAAEYEFAFPALAERTATADATTRYVLQLADGERTECVRIPGDTDRVTLCLSSQVGCALGCTFCVSGLYGVKRNLTSAEIVAQALLMLGDAAPPARTNVVFMGMGEALLNLEQVERAYRILSSELGPGLALRRMTISTAGHVPALERFGKLARRPRLAISLNATTDEVRDRIMPINRSWPIAELLDACRRFPRQPAERITLEYVLLAGVNDSPEDARRLPGLVRGLPVKLNLIPWNKAQGFAFETPAAERVDAFARELHAAGIIVTVRRPRGREADAACGQLALRRDAEETRS